MSATPLATTFLQSDSFIYVLYIIAFALFIQGLRGLAGPTTAVRGNRIAGVGMAIAVVATLLSKGEGNWGLIVLGVALGVAVGVPAARQVKMTAMPQMVALFNGVGGGAVALISWVEFRHYGATYGSHTEQVSHEFASGASLHAFVHTSAVPTYVAVFSVFAAIVGSVSFWGSNIAFAKLQEILPGRPISFGSAQQIVNLVLLVLALAAGVDLVAGAHSELLFVGMLVVAALLGNAVVLPIGGADMPVVISLLNAFTGLSAAATGVALNNPALIVAGMIVGASGTILTNLMATAMNRSIPSIIAGGFGGGGAVAGAEGAGEHAGTVKSTSAADAAIQLAYASRVVVIPGYGMAVAQAQHAVRELTKELEKRGVEVTYAIHPVAGRMPGHMNVLLAEADVPYDQLKEMDDANPEFERTDVSLVIGANDVTNPAAQNTPSSPIYGMPILEVNRSHSVIVIKRSMNPGFAGIENELYYDPKTAMLFGDAKSAVSEITSELDQI
ncbi:MAG TPA: NAD(P)(+) transhydrogenase (Re/Si-specific) subunit beta [Solirubrobacteraceae bacterium]|jgi:NAD(P) transhydrogenase subunit beta|nr:NAD(P)(+) transhydrogenase (Re/Si-specific) subunit beta [Solirubrobacteraceae bacterium]